MNYSIYKFTKSDCLIIAVKSAAIVFVIGFLFYSSPVCAVAFPFVFAFVLKIERVKKLTLQKRRLSEAFKELLRALSANLTAGYSAENAFKEAYADICRIYGVDCIMASEMYAILLKLANNGVLEELLADFGERSGIEDIRDFGEVFKIAKRSGGDISSVLKLCADTIREKMEVERDIKTLLTAKKFEQSIMNIVPFLIIAYVRFSSGGMLDCLYHNPAGITVMTICLAVYATAYLMAGKIVDIKI